MNATLYHHPNCSTCKKARAWLTAHGLTPTLIDLRDQAPTVEVLRGVLQRSALPLRKLFNTSGQAYRAGDFKVRLETMSDDDALAALAADGMLVKRPMLVTERSALVGFKEAEWAAALG
jgi:arsenate reductase (glutaredoxin)